MVRTDFPKAPRAARLLAALLALGVWQAMAFLVGNRLLLVGPVQVLLRLGQLTREGSFWKAIGFTFCRISLGFGAAFLAALVLAVVSARFPLAEILVKPYLVTIQTVPVASFIVLAFLWLSGRQLSSFISFLMVLPVLYANFLQGIRSADPQLLEMARVFRISLPGRVRSIYLPALEPYLYSACHVALGLCWKAGVAAEVIGVCSGSIGQKLYEAKVYLEIADLFAWTLVIVGVSLGFEWVFRFLLGRCIRRLEAV